MGTEPNAPALTELPARGGGVTWRAFLVGILCVVVLSLLSPVADVLVGSFVAARNQAPALATLIFFGVVFANLLGKCLFRNPLSAAEQMVAYCMVLITAGIPSTGLADYLIPHLVGIFYFAKPENDFAATYFPYIPDWLVPSKNPEGPVVIRFFLGRSLVPWAPWIRPLALWSTFFMAMYVLQLCVANVLRKQWVERERLVFPLIQLPLSLVEEEKGKKSAPVLRDPLFWGAAAVVAALYTYNGMKNYFPFLKPVPLSINLTPYIPTSIATHVAGATAMIYPAVVGFFYFATLEVSFSVAFFFIYMRLQQVIGGLLGVDWFIQTKRLGYSFGPGAAIGQEVGAVIALVLFGLFVMRHHIRDVLKSFFRGFAHDRVFQVSLVCSIAAAVLAFLAVALGGLLPASLALYVALFTFLIVFFILSVTLSLPRATLPASSGAPVLEARQNRGQVDDSHEAIPYGASVIGIIVGILVLALFLNAAGMSFWLAFTLMVMMVFWLIVLSRMVADGGIVWGQIGVEPYKIVTTVVGTRAISTPNWTIIGYVYLFVVDMQAMMMPAAIQTLKISDEERLHRRKLLLAMLVAIVISIPLGYYSNLAATYQLGASKTNAWTDWGLVMSPPWPFDQAMKEMANPQGPDWHGITFIIVGAATMGLLFLLRYLFVWWPIHPIGMTLMGSWAMYKLWFSALLAFGIKAVILRYGGLKVYNRLKPLFLGMIFAGFAIPAILLVVNLLVGTTLYDVGAWP